MKVIRKKIEIKIENIVEKEDFSKYILANDVIVFTCLKCGSVGSRKAYRFSKPLTENSFLCGKCKIKQTNIERYGVDNPAKNKEIKEKTKKTNLEKYGVETSLLNKDVKEKTKKTNLEKYGVEYSCSSVKAREKAKQTYLKKFGVENPFQNEEIKKKIKQTSLKKYGCEHHLQNKNILNKLKITNKEKYGVEIVLQSKQIREKCKNTILEKYGSLRPLEIKDKAKKTRLINHYKDLKNKFNNIVKPLFNLENYKGTFIENKYEWECLKCGNIFEDHIDTGRIPRCKICFPSIGTSNKEKEVAEFIKPLGFEIIENYRDKFELDIFIPSLNFGIEFDGLYWHSDSFVDKNYHIEKTLYFKEKGIDIIHIFEDEWDNKQEIVKSIIKSRLNKFDRIIYARKTEIRNVEIEEERNFLNENHIQGYIPSSLCWGLYYENELISLMSFGKSRFNKNYEWELLRFVNKLNTKVIGGASKLFNNTGITNIISYCDLRYFTGNIYEKLGFELLGQSKPNYYYVKNSNRYSRIKFQKHKLKDLLENFDEELTEKENMKNNKYKIIYDCGMLVWNKKAQ